MGWNLIYIVDVFNYGFMREMVMSMVPTLALWCLLEHCYNATQSIPIDKGDNNLEILQFHALV